MDVGCGSFPILALAAALYHPKAEVQAIEIHPVAAESATGLIEIFGLSDRLHVVNADIGNHTIDPNTSAAVTETFNAGLVDEPGPQIVRLLHEAGVPYITPASAELQLRVGDAVFSHIVDLRRDSCARIFIDGTGFCSNQPPKPRITTAFYDDKGLVLDHEASSISNPLDLDFFSEQLLDVLLREKKEVLRYKLGGTFKPELIRRCE